MTDSIRPLILTATPAFQPFASVPRTLTRAELGLPDDWDARWEQEEITSFSHLLAKLAEEAWARTEEPRHNAATAPPEIAVPRGLGDHHTYIALESVMTVELFAMAGQAALLGWGLAMTMHYAGDLELWIQQAMELVGLRMMPPEARRAANEAWHLAHEEDARQHGESVQPRRANWEDAPTRRVVPDTTSDATSS